MTIEIRLILAAIAVLAIITGGFAIKAWDDGRMDAAYERGVAAERSVWVEAQAQANKLQQEAQDAARATTDRVADSARQAADKHVDATAKKTNERRDRINDEYLKDPESASSCDPDGTPAPIPDGVQNLLREAERAAEAASG